MLGFTDKNCRCDLNAIFGCFVSIKSHFAFTGFTWEWWQNCWDFSENWLQSWLELNFFKEGNSYSVKRIVFFLAGKEQKIKIVLFEYCTHMRLDSIQTLAVSTSAIGKGVWMDLVFKRFILMNGSGFPLRIDFSKRLWQFFRDPCASSVLDSGSAFISFDFVVLS